MSIMTSVGEGRTIALLLMLRDGPLIMKDLKAVIPNAQTLRNRLEMMESDGLINISVVTVNHKQVVASLTDLGREAVMLFSMVDLSVSPGKELSEKSIDMKHFDTVVRMLRGKEYVVQRELRDSIGTFDTVIRVLERMESEGIVNKVDNRKGGREIRYSLTSAGRSIADVYQNIYNKICGQR